MSKSQAQTLPTHLRRSTSDAPVFLTNLRLLDLDKHNDWPSISAETFSTKDVQQNQKNRIRCVEWVLYRLFEIWDLEETRNKLRPFFPPLEPLQSLNLRATLFRCLNELKKNGVLGRDVTVRKTMLDECKGEKLKEVLVSFSTIVLQKVTAREKTERISTVRRLALARNIAPKEQESLLPLAIAHRISLTALLRRKERLRARFLAFQRLLDEKEQDLLRKSEQLQAGGDDDDKSPAVSDIVFQKIKTQFDTHWQGDPKWIDVIIRGEEQNVHDALLETPFSRIWSLVRKGTIDDINAIAQQGLLQDLEKRVMDQQARLQHWRKVREDFRKGSHSESPNGKEHLGSGRIEGIGLQLHEHKELVPDSKNKTPARQRPAYEASTSGIVDDYKTLIESLQCELVNASKNIPPAAKSRQNDYQRPVSIGQGDSSEDKRDSSRASNKFPALFLQKSNTPGDESLATFNVPKTADPVKNLVSSEQESERTDSESDSDIESGSGTLRESHTLFAEQKQDPTTGNGGLSTQLVGTNELEAKLMPSNVMDEDEMLAEQMISSITNAAPSPTKPKLSLAQRTRQSMGFSISDYHHGNSMLDTPTPPPSIPSTINTSPTQPDVSSIGQTTLLERTRQSMTFLPSKIRDPHKPTHKSRFSKHYPTNQFGTPNKQTPSMACREDSTPPEELLTGQADYASVFKSRPKIALSPTLSPSIDRLPTVDDLDESFGEDDIHGQWGVSPSVRRTGKIGGA